MRLLSVLIPARNEEWLKRTVEDVLANIEGDTEIIVVADGNWPKPALEQNPRVTLIHQPSSIGQRASTNMAARVSTAQFVMKLDAHCRVSKGFDVALAREAATLGPATCQIPAQYNLHGFNWVCTAGHIRYQGPTLPGCPWKPKGATDDDPPCGAAEHREIVWEKRRRHLTTSWHFDSKLHFQYFKQHQKDHREPVHDVMSCLGACWFVDREHWLKLGMLDEQHGSWGQMGTEIACKYWLSGGRMVVNKNAWFAHLFRTQGGDFGFPYPISGDQQAQAKARSRHLWMEGAWPMAIRSLKSLVEQFNPPGWKQEEIDGLEKGTNVSGHTAYSSVVEREARGSVSPSLSWAFEEDDAGEALSGAGSGAPIAGCIWYTDHRPEERILRASLDTVRASGLPVVAVGIEHVPYIDILVPNVQRGYLTMFKQILAGLQALKTRYVFFTEHDVLYHPSHFDFTPPRDDVYYYNLNVWKVDVKTGKAVTYITKQTSGLVGNRELLIKHYTERIRRVKLEGFSRRMGFEPGSHNRKERVDDVPSSTFSSLYPNIDLRHSKNLTSSRWRQDQFRDQRNCRGWQESDSENIPGWPNLHAYSNKTT